MQQLHITVAYQIEPADRGFEYRVAGTVDSVQRHTERHAQHQCEQDFFRQAPSGVAGLRQAEEQGEEHQQIEDQRQIHEDSDKTCAGCTLGQPRTGKPNSLKTNELISKTYDIRRFWNKRMSLSEMQLARKGRGRSLTDEDCHTYLLASISFTFREKRQ
ncbi:hypothetical protein D3C78_1353650 [compost metagenome]